MKQLSTLLAAMVLALWIGTIAIVSVQNFAPVSLRFWQYESFAMPMGLILAFSVGLGLVGAAIAHPLLLGKRSRRRYRADFDD